MVSFGFMEHCIQSSVTHVRGVECVQWPITPPGGKAI